MRNIGLLVLAVSPVFARRVVSHANRDPTKVALVVTEVCMQYHVSAEPDDTYGVSCETFMDNLKAGMKPEEALKAIPAADEIQRHADFLAGEAEKDGSTTTSTTTMPSANMCRCETPGAGTAGHNKFKCDDGTERYCAASDECFNGDGFTFGQWHEGCRTKKKIQWHQEVEDFFKNFFR